MAGETGGQLRYWGRKLFRKVWQTFLYGLWIAVRPFAERRKEPASVRNVLLLPVGGIGNVILFTPVVSLLRKRYPDARLTFVLRSRGAAEVLRGYANAEFIEFDFRSMKDVRRFVRSHSLPRFDLALNCETFYGAYLAFLCGTRLILSFTYSFGVTAQSDFLCHRARNVDHGKHEVLQYFDLYRMIDSDVERLGEETFVHIGEEEKEFAKSAVAEARRDGGPLIGMHIGSLPEVPEKRWPAERFADLIGRLARTEGAKVLVVGGRGEEAERDLLRTLLDAGVSIADFVGKTSLKETAALIRECDLFISNDSGPMHIASAVGTPVVGIFGPTNPEKNRPWSGKAPTVVVRRDLECSPCYRAFSGFVRCTNPNLLECLTSVTVDDVYHAARRLLSTGRNRSPS